ncbi:MAG: ribosomal protein S18-alanine N-acetyltransferase [Candidatus Angelobacter sp.]
MVRVRRAEAADLQRLMEIAAHSATAALWTRKEYEKVFAQNQPRPRVALVVEEEDIVLGFLVSSLVDEEWEIENIAVSGPARRRGLGSRLLGEFLDLVRSRGGKEIYLEVRESNRAARALYEKWGFTEAGRREDYYDDPAEDALLLSFSFPDEM